MTDSQPDRPTATTDLPCDLGHSDADWSLRIRRLLVFGSISVAIGLCFSNGHLDPFSLTAMTLAAWAGIGAMLLGKRPSLFGTPGRLESWLAKSPERFLWWGILLSVAINAVLPPGYYADRARLGLFRPLLLLAGLLVLSYRRKVQPPILVRFRFPLILVLSAAMSVVVMRASPRPAIDVWHVLQLGAEGLARGENPYTLEYPNIYAVTSQYVSKQFLSADGSHTHVYPYLPLPLLASTPSALLVHDVRWTFLACVLFSAWVIRRLGRGALEAELAAVLLLLQPRAFFLLEQSWTEPLVLAAVALTLLAIAAWRASQTPVAGAWIATGLAGGLAAASKQYSPVILVPLLFALPARGWIKAAVLAAGVAAAITLPFVFWNPNAFVSGILSNQQYPFRSDALSWLAAIAWLGGPQLPFWPSFILATVVLISGLGRRISLAQSVTTAAAAFLVLLLLHKQAFCNYYWLAGSLFGLAIALHQREALDASVAGERKTELQATEPAA